MKYSLSSPLRGVDVREPLSGWGHAYYCAEDFARSRWAGEQAALRDACAAQLLGLHDLAAAALAGAARLRGR